MLTATTSKFGPPSLVCRFSSAGISLRQGRHQVAHRFTSTVRPRQSESFLGLPSASSKARSGSRNGTVAMVSAATSPCARGVRRRATSTAPRQAGSPAALRFSPPIPYTPANPITAPISTAPMVMGIRRTAAGGSEGRSGISFVILYQIRLCRAWMGRAGNGAARLVRGRDDEWQIVNNKS